MAGKAALRVVACLIDAWPCSLSGSRQISQINSRSTVMAWISCPSQQTSRAWHTMVSPLCTQPTPLAELCTKPMAGSSMTTLFRSLHCKSSTVCAANTGQAGHRIQQMNTNIWQAKTGALCKYATEPRVKQKASAAELAMYGAAVVVGMIGITYAMIPLYKAICAATGYGGAVAGAETVEEKMKRRQENPNTELEKKAAQREIRVWFNADVADNMPWDFQPTQPCVSVKAGQSVLAFFTAHNKSDTPVTGYSVYNVTPDRAAQYFNKIQCFCFEEQRLRANEAVDMPVFFYVDPEFVADWNCRNINDITLSYVFHKVDDEDLEQQDDDDDNYVPGSGIKLHGPGLAPIPHATVQPAVTSAESAAAIAR